MLCPYCGIEVEVLASQAGTEVTCPDCREVFEVRLDGQIEARPAAREKLDELRVRQMMLGRRSAYRQWGFMMFGAGLAVVCAGQLLINAYRTIRERGRTDWIVLYIATAVLLVGIAIRLFMRGKALRREVDKPMLEEPATPPDFSGLSDGSQHAANLERMPRKDAGE